MLTGSVVVHRRRRRGGVWGGGWRCCGKVRSLVMWGEGLGSGVSREEDTLVFFVYVGHYDGPLGLSRRGSIAWWRLQRGVRSRDFRLWLDWHQPSRLDPFLCPPKRGSGLVSSRWQRVSLLSCERCGAAIYRTPPWSAGSCCSFVRSRALQNDDDEG